MLPSTILDFGKCFLTESDRAGAVGSFVHRGVDDATPPETIRLAPGTRGADGR